MKINSAASRISNNFSDNLIKLGRSVKTEGSWTSKVNKFTEGRGMNSGRGAFLDRKSVV